MVVYLASDLMWATRIKTTGEDAGVPCRPVRDVGMLEARLADSDVRGVILDLEAPERAQEMLLRLRGEGAGEAERAIRVVAFGPHVQRELLRQAQAAGADAVLTRGAFDHNLGEILVKLESGGRL